MWATFDIDNPKRLGYRWCRRYDPMSNITHDDDSTPRPRPHRILITGNTYPVKDRLRALGGYWHRKDQGWLVPAHRAAEARAIVQSAGPLEDRPRVRRAHHPYRPDYVSNIATFSDGTEIYTNKRGRCEDAPCCGCCS